MNTSIHLHGKSRLFRRGPGSAALLALFGLAVATTQASAARIDVDRGGANPTVTVRGTLESEDGKRFTDAVAGLTKAMVILNSNGGSLDAGLTIGRTIRHNNFTTGVPSGVQCASACALAWLGGTTRYMANSARIGFHAAYVEGKGGPRESGVGNALVGAYLNSLGLPEEAVVYMTSPPPSEIQWLTMEDARKMGVTVALLTPQMAPNMAPNLPPNRSDPPPRGPNVAGPAGPMTRPDPDGPKPLRPTTMTSPRPPQVDPDDRPTRPATTRQPRETQTALRQQALEFIGEYFDHFSDLDARAMEYVGDLYAARVDFNGKPTDRTEIIDAKQKFIERWPTRVYTLRPESIQISCDQGAADCIIKGLVDWECMNVRRGARSAGVMDFVIGATFSTSGEVTVYRESGKMISRNGAE